MLTCFFFQKDISKDNKKLVGFEGGGEAGVCTVGYLSQWPNGIGKQTVNERITPI
jgi:hypothetical protein